MSNLQEHTRETLEDLTRRQLQDLAKIHGIKANKKSAIIIEELLELKAQEEEETAAIDEDDEEVVVVVVEDDSNEPEVQADEDENENEHINASDTVQAPSPTQQNENENTRNATRRAEDDLDEENRRLSIMSTESGILSVAIPSESNSAKRRRIQVYQDEDISEGGEVRFMRGDRRVLGEKPIPPPAEGSSRRSPTPYDDPDSEDGYGYPYPHGHYGAEEQGCDENEPEPEEEYRLQGAVSFYDGPPLYDYDDGSDKENEADEDEADKENQPDEDEADKENQPSAEEGEKENADPARYEEPEWLRHYNLYGVIPVSPDDPNAVIFDDAELEYPPIPPISAPMRYVERDPRVIEAAREREAQHWAALRRRLDGFSPYPGHVSPQEQVPSGSGHRLPANAFKTPSPRITMGGQSPVPRESPERSASESPDRAATSLSRAGHTPHPSHILRARETPQSEDSETSDAPRTPPPVFTRRSLLVPAAGQRGSPSESPEDRAEGSSRQAGPTPHPSRALRARDALRSEGGRTSDALRTPPPQAMIPPVFTRPRQSLLAPPADQHESPSESPDRAEGSSRQAEATPHSSRVLEMPTISGSRPRLTSDALRTPPYQPAMNRDPREQMSDPDEPVSPRTALSNAMGDLTRAVLHPENAIEIDPAYAHPEYEDDQYYYYEETEEEVMEREMILMKQELRACLTDTIEHTKIVLGEHQEIMEAAQEAVKDCKDMLNRGLVWKLASLEKNILGKMKSNTTIIDGSAFMENEEDRKKWRKWQKQQWEKENAAHEDIESSGSTSDESGDGEFGQAQSVSVSSGSVIVEGRSEPKKRYYEQFEEFKEPEEIDEQEGDQEGDQEVPATAVSNAVDLDDWDDMYV